MWLKWASIEYTKRSCQTWSSITEISEFFNVQKSVWLLNGYDFELGCFFYTAPEQLAISMLLS